MAEDDPIGRRSRQCSPTGPTEQSGLNDTIEDSMLNMMADCLCRQTRISNGNGRWRRVGDGWISMNNYLPT